MESNSLKSITQNNRLPYLDYGRVFAAYLVIFGHLLLTDDTTIRPYIYSFHMPFFFLVSGMLHKDRGGDCMEQVLENIDCSISIF